MKVRYTIHDFCSTR